MARNAVGAFVIPWHDCEVDGEAGTRPQDLMVGVCWSWHGDTVRLDGPQSILPLGSSLDGKRVHERMARRMSSARYGDDKSLDPPVWGPGFSVTDGRNVWSFSLITGAAGRGTLCFTLDGIPPRDRALWVLNADINADHMPVARTRSKARGVVCFTPGTRLSTPQGIRCVEDIVEGDLIDTKDNGPQEVLWRGERRISGAGLRAMPELAPVRLRRGALGVDIPDEPLLVSPDHRVVLTGPHARDLFNSDELLVAARDLIDGKTVTVQYGLRDLRYIHLALPSHQIVMANGVETESFDPQAAGLDSIPQDDRARLLDRLPDLEHSLASYGDPARRVLTLAEAQILRKDSHLL